MHFNARELLEHHCSGRHGLHTVRENRKITVCCPWFPIIPLVLMQKCGEAAGLGGCQVLYKPAVPGERNLTSTFIAFGVETALKPLKWSTAGNQVSEGPFRSQNPTSLRSPFPTTKLTQDKMESEKRRRIHWKNCDGKKERRTSFKTELHRFSDQSASAHAPGYSVSLKFSKHLPHNGILRCNVRPGLRKQALEELVRTILFFGKEPTLTKVTGLLSF